MENETELFCIGNALVDIFAQGEEDIDLRFGLNDKVQHVPMEQMREILSMLPQFSICSGGGAANVAKIAGLLGINTVFAGALGAAPEIDLETPDSRTKRDIDQFGLLFEEQLEEAGVKTLLVRKTSPTGICLILQMNNSEVKIAASPSAALEFTETDLDEEYIRKAKVVVLDGYMLDRQTMVRHILELSHKYGTVVALDLSSTGLAAERATEIVTYARAYPLIIFMNEDEAKAFYYALIRKQEPAAKDIALSNEITSLFKDFTSHDIFPILTVKLGNRGALVFAGGNIFREETIPVIPMENTGAGDAFCAAFLAAWIRNKPLSACAALGNKAAREVLDVRGAQADPKAIKQLGKQLK